MSASWDRPVRPPLRLRLIVAYLALRGVSVALRWIGAVRRRIDSLLFAEDNG